MWGLQDTPCLGRIPKDERPAETQSCSGRGWSGSPEGAWGSKQGAKAASASFPSQLFWKPMLGCRETTATRTGSAPGLSGHRYGAC